MALTPEEQKELNELKGMLAQVEPQQPKSVGQEAMDMMSQASPTNIMAKLSEMKDKAFDVAGENVAQNLASGVSLKAPNMSLGFPVDVVQPTPGQGFRTSPETAAKVGLGIQYADDLVENALPAIGASRGIGNLANRIKAFMKRPSVDEAKVLLQESLAHFDAQPTVAEKAARVGDEMIAPVAKKVEAIKQRATDIPEHFRQKGKEALRLKREAGTDMGKAEEAMGAGFKPKGNFERTVADPKRMRAWTDKANKIVAKGEEHVKQMKPQLIQLYRKVIQEGGDKLSNVGKAHAEKSREVFAKVLEESSDAFKQARQRFHEAKQLIDDLPDAQRLAKEETKRQLLKASEELAQMQKQAKQLAEAARKADRMTRKRIQLEGMRLIREAQEKEKLLKRLSGSLTTAAIGGSVLGSGYAVYKAATK